MVVIGTGSGPGCRQPGYPARIRIGTEGRQAPPTTPVDADRGPAGSAGRSRGTHFPCFDGLRAFAALAVVGVHTAFSSGFDGRSSLGRYASRLEIGVSVFFVISGFLLYRPFAVSHLSGRPAPAARGFWVRRLKRILPAYWLAFVVVTYVLHADAVVHVWYAPLVYLGFAQIYLPEFVLTGLTQAWSLCTEMTFYLMVPLWAAALGRRARRPAAQLRAELAGVALLVAVSLAWRSAVVPGRSPLEHTMPNWLPGYVDLFALGMLLAVASAWCATQDRRPAWLWHPALPWVSWSLAAVAFVAVSNLGLPLTPVTGSALALALARQTLYGAFAFLLVTPAVFGPQDRGLPRALLRWRPLALAGVVSYGIYLWHEAAIDVYLRWTGNHLFAHPWWQMYAVAASLAIASATASYVVVERPVLRHRRPGRPPAAGGPALPATRTVAASTAPVAPVVARP